MENYKNINIGYELWNRGYPLKNCSPIHEVRVYDLYISLYELGYVKNVDDFIEYMKDTDLFYNAAEEEEKFSRENQPKVREYFEKYFEGKTWEDISQSEELIERWDFYSDWHKDAYGYRPHGIVCGEYINPHI